MGLDTKTIATTRAYIRESLRGAGAIQGKPGKDGKSAYQIAIDNGFTGTESEWLESLKGKDGNFIEITLGDIKIIQGTL